MKKNKILCFLLTTAMLTSCKNNSTVEKYLTYKTEEGICIVNIYDTSLGLKTEINQDLSTTFNIYPSTSFKPFIDDYYKEYNIDPLNNVIILETTIVDYNTFLNEEKKNLFNDRYIIDDFPSYTKYKEKEEIINKSKNEIKYTKIDYFIYSIDFRSFNTKKGYINFSLSLYNKKTQEVIYDDENSRTIYGISVGGEIKINYEIINGKIIFFII